jgi:hypothetical protein
VNRDVSITLYRDHRFGLEERQLELATLANHSEFQDFEQPSLAATQG